MNQVWRDHANQLHSISSELVANSNTGTSDSSHFCNKRSDYEGHFHDTEYILPLT